MQKEGKLECSECDYITSSEKLLKSHVNKKYKDQKKTEFPRECNLCDVEVKSTRDLKLHMRNHTCKSVQLQCTLCNYGAYDEIEIDIHFGKEHGENYNNGLF